MKKHGIPRRPQAAATPRGEKHPCWNGGRTLDKHGYVLVHATDHPHASRSGRIREHRLVMEKAIGRILEKHEVVHHLNSDTQDNRPENLELFSSNAQHLQETIKGRCPKWTPGGLLRIQAGLDKIRLHLDEADVRRLIEAEGMKLADAAKELGCSSNSLGRYLKKHGIQLRSSLSWPHSAKHKFPSRDDLVAMYDQASLAQIAKKIGCGEGTVHRLMEHYQIPRRPVGERGKLTHHTPGQSTPSGH